MNPTLGVQEGCQLQCTLRRDPVELSFMSHPSILFLCHISFHISTYLPGLPAPLPLHPILPPPHPPAPAHQAAGAGQPTVFLISYFKSQVRQVGTVYFPLLWTTLGLPKDYHEFQSECQKEAFFFQLILLTLLNIRENPVYTKFHLV